MNQPVHSLRNFVVYRSSAGSGKTFTLVLEFLKLALSSDYSGRYRSILAITFTNKAAAEMKSRIIDHLKGFSEGEGSHGFDKNMQLRLLQDLNVDEATLQKRAFNTLQHMLHNYSDLSVSTIDRFVHRLIRSFSRDLQLSPDFEVSTDSGEVLEKSVDNLMDRVGSDKDLTEILKGFVKSKIDEEKDWEIANDLKSIGEQIFQEDAMVYLHQLKMLEAKDFLRIKKELFGEKKALEDEVKKLAEKGLKLIDDQNIPHNTFTHSDVPNFLKKCFIEIKSPGKRLYGNCEAGNWYSKKTDEIYKSQIDSLAPELIEILSSIFELTDTEFTQSAKAKRYNLVCAVLNNIDSMAVINELEKEVSRFKEERNLVLVGDFNQLVSNVVSNNPAPFIYERIGEKFSNYLIDEFQDTSVLQWQNFLPLFHNALSTEKFTMLVGDGKQAIYRFRNGDVEQFAALPQLKGQKENEFLTEYALSLERNYSPQQLGTNYRSKAEIVNFNNQFFEALRTSEPAIQTIYDAHSQIPHKEEGGYVNVEKLESDDKEELEILYLDKVLSIVEECLTDGYHQRDIAIITRYNKDAIEVSNMLIAQEGKDYKVLSAESLVLENDPKVQLVMSYIRWLLFPDDRPAQVKLAEKISIQVKGKVDGEFVMELVEEREINYEKLSEFGIDLTDTLRHQSSLTPYELVESVVRQFDLLSEPNVFIEFLLDAAFGYAQKSDNSLHGFLDWWDEKGHKQSIRTTEGTDAIHVMTIHKCKGLQFPIVIFPYANLPIRNPSSHWISLENEELPVAFVRFRKDSTTEYHDLYDEEKSRLLLDNVNLFYVATTRPKTRLYVLYGSTKSDDMTKIIDSALKEKFETEGTLELGQKLKPDQTEKQDKEESFGEKQLQEVSSFEFREKLKVSYQAPFAWEVDAPEKDREHGNKLHRIMALIYRADDFRKAIDRVAEEGWINSSEVVEIENSINELLNDEKAGNWYKPGWEVFTEVDLLSARGVVLRPDRIQYNNEKCLVIDYKTGQVSPSHEKQMRQYVSEVGSILQRKTEGYLIYFDPWKIVQVV